MQILHLECESAVSYTAKGSSQVGYLERPREHRTQGPALRKESAAGLSPRCPSEAAM
jgi:hypothetical protein